MERPQVALTASGGSATQAERLFLAVALDDEARAALASRIDAALGDRHMPGRAVLVPSWHITLRFLGKTTETERDILLGYLHEHVTTAAFTLRFATIGAFPRPKRATVLWLGVDRGTHELADLGALCEEAAQAAGRSPEERPFHAHLTLSRIRPPVDVTWLTDGVEPIGVRLDVDEITLFRSVLGGNRPARYEVVDTVAL